MSVRLFTLVALICGTSSTFAYASPQSDLELGLRSTVESLRVREISERLPFIESLILVVHRADSAELQNLPQRLREELAFHLDLVLGSLTQSGAGNGPIRNSIIESLFKLKTPFSRGLAYRHMNGHPNEVWNQLTQSPERAVAAFDEWLGDVNLRVESTVEFTRVPHSERGEFTQTWGGHAAAGADLFAYRRTGENFPYFQRNMVGHASLPLHLLGVAGISELIAPKIIAFIVATQQTVESYTEKEFAIWFEQKLALEMQHVERQQKNGELAAQGISFEEASETILNMVLDSVKPQDHIFSHPDVIRMIDLLIQGPDLPLPAHYDPSLQKKAVAEILGALTRAPTHATFQTHLATKVAEFLAKNQNCAQYLTRP